MGIEAATRPRSRARWARRICSAALATAALAASAPASAEGAGPFWRGFVDEKGLQGPNAAARATAFDLAAGAGAQVVRINVRWARTAGERPTDPRNPADPAYDFSAIDAAVRDASERALHVILTVFKAPPWVEGPNRRPGAGAGTWKPDPAAFGDYGEALARRYSGGFAGLPRVEYFEAWNEPNLSDYLTPQYAGGRPAGADRYRRLVNAFYAGVKRGNPGAKVVAGATAPYGDDPPDASRTRPLTFLRELLCLRGRRALEPTACPHPAWLDIVSHHPINLLTGPRGAAPHPDDLTVAGMGRLRKTVRAAERAGNALPRGRHRPLWATEIWWLTDPPNEHGFPPRKQARWLQQTFYLLWKQGIRAVLWLQLIDAGGFGSGLYFGDGGPKPSLTAFRFPFVTEPRARGLARAWGIAPATGTLRIQRRRDDGWQTIESLQATDGDIFKAGLRLPGVARVRAEVAGERSLTWTQTR